LPHAALLVKSFCCVDTFGDVHGIKSRGGGGSVFGCIQVYDVQDLEPSVSTGRILQGHLGNGGDHCTGRGSSCTLEGIDTRCGVLLAKGLVVAAGCNTMRFSQELLCLLDACQNHNWGNRGSCWCTQEQTSSHVFPTSAALHENSNLQHRQLGASLHA